MIVRGELIRRVVADRAHGAEVNLIDLDALKHIDAALPGMLKHEIVTFSS